MQVCWEESERQCKTVPYCTTSHEEVCSTEYETKYERKWKRSAEEEYVEAEDADEDPKDDAEDDEEVKDDGECREKRSHGQRSYGHYKKHESIPAVVAAAPVVAQVKAEVVKKQVTESFLVQPTNQGTSQEYTEVVTWMLELEGQTQAVLAMYSLHDIQEGEVLS